MSGVVGTLRSFSIRYAALAVGALLVIVPVVEAGNEEETEPTSEGLFSLDYLDAYLEFEAEYARTRVETKSRDSFRPKRIQKNREWGLEERIGLKLGGSFVDPSFITYSSDFSFALTQDWFKERIDSYDHTDTDHGYLLQYDTRMDFFQGKIISGSIHTIRRDNRINRRFQSTLNERRTGYGTSWVFTHEKLPMELTYDYLETDRTGNRDYRDDEHFTDSTLHYGVDWLVSDHHRFKFSYEHANTKQEYQGLYEPFETTRDLLTVEHELEFGDDHQHDVRTLIHWQEESGDFARDLFEIGPQLKIQHTDNLQTMYKYQFNRERYAGLDIETQRADFQLVHQLHTNLTTTVDVFGLYEDIEDDINTTQYGASVDWQYNRKNRFGRLYANLALAYDTEDVEGDNGRRVVLDEAHTFSDPFTLILRNREVVLHTVVVTDSTNRRVFQVGADYLVYSRGNVTRIARVLNGRIADGDTVLVDYQFRTPADGKLDTIRMDFSLEQRFANGLTPYYRWSYRNQEDDVSFGYASRADRTDHHRLGVKYEAKRFTLGGEVEVFDDTVEPYDAFHLDGMMRVVESVDHNMNLSSRLSRLYFEGGIDDRDVTMLDVELDHRWHLTERLSTIQRVAYRFEDDSFAGDTHAWDVTTGVEYAVGDLFGELTLEYDRLELPDSDEEDFGLYFRIRRDIPNVLGLQ
ncbi:MAG: hypothetical protein JSU63_11375 [Phycisphaerales bacterium]|nr:MAG: hypothetical protein JSU63_11375 [Phycisphaerales bacterium]